MPRAGSCRVCAHPRCAEIDGRLGTGEPERSIAAAVGLPRGTIHTHWTRCRKSGKVAPPSLAPVPLSSLVLPPVEVPAGHPVAPLLAQLGEIHGHALTAYQDAVDRKDVNQQILLLPQLRNNIRAQEAMLAKIEQPKNETERLLGHPDFAETALALARVMDRFPEARAAYVAELERLCGETVQ